MKHFNKWYIISVIADALIISTYFLLSNASGDDLDRNGTYLYLPILGLAVVILTVLFASVGKDTRRKYAGLFVLNFSCLALFANRTADWALWNADGALSRDGASPWFYQYTAHQENISTAATILSATCIVCIAIVILPNVWKLNSRR